ncbi:MAG: undecaprenyldiphospho-muramoylpentapeptide beta-N-acetylglucosaminyltransferase [Chitinophagaceae bacterium]|nr:undecaprenyldiphospho-muramoylpentapeptide beta-N-acetylglucosaminyltransferase [Chitinophagaceae bacterium]
MKTEDYIKSLEDLDFKKSTLSSRRIIIAGGGTGGHIFPAIAIANALIKQQPGTEILFVGALGKMEMKKVPEAGFNIVGLYIAGYNRSSFMKNITLPFKLAKSFYQVTQILRSFRPDAIIGVGGYSSFPVVRLAQTRQIPTFIHESNSLPGRSNKLLARRAKRVFVSSESMNQYFLNDNLVVTGNPVRSSIYHSEIIRSEAMEYFGLKLELKTVLVVGGSLGAKSINEAINANISAFKQNNLQLIWQTGKSFADDAAHVEEENPNTWTRAFIDKMEYAYAAADIVVSRAGAMTVSELCIVGKPVIFIPYPYASEDHQTANAMALVKKKAALVVKDSEVQTKLINLIIDLVNDTELMKELRGNIKKEGKTNADDLIASEILKVIND